MAIAVDFSDARPSIGELQAAEVVLVIRYLTGAGGKALTLTEMDDYRAVGIVICFVFEISATDAEGGQAAGARNASAALTALRDLGTVGCPVYFAVDQSIAPENALAYFDGITSIMQPSQVGVYGEGALCSYLQTEGLATWFWQSESTSFPGNATTLPITHLQQVYNASPVPGTDLDKILKADVGQWPRPAPPVVTVTLPTLGGLTGNALPYWTKSVQALLIEKMGQSAVTLTGVYDAATTAGVENVQRFFGMPLTGVVDLATWNVLLGF